MTNKSPVGPDTIPAQQHKTSDTAVIELHHLIRKIWDTEQMPDNFVLADVLTHYKKKCKNNRSNYRILALLNHSYKIFAMILLM